MSRVLGWSLGSAGICLSFTAVGGEGLVLSILPLVATDLGCRLESPRDLLKIPMPRPYPRSFQSESLG